MWDAGSRAAVAYAWSVLLLCYCKGETIHHWTRRKHVALMSILNEGASKSVSEAPQCLALRTSTSVFSFLLKWLNTWLKTWRKYFPTAVICPYQFYGFEWAWPLTQRLPFGIPFCKPCRQSWSCDNKMTFVIFLPHCDGFHSHWLAVVLLVGKMLVDFKEKKKLEIRQSEVCFRFISFVLVKHLFSILEVAISAILASLATISLCL